LRQQSVNKAGKEEHLLKEKQLWDQHFDIYPNIESAEWINFTLKQIYKRHGEKLGIYIASMINPQIERFRPNFIKAVRIDEIKLGEIAPFIHNFKVNNKENNILDIECYVNYPSDLNILVTIKGGMGLVSVPIVIEKITLFANVKVVVDYMDAFPLVKTVHLSVLRKPTIEFELRPLKGFDMTAFPGLSTELNNLINNIVINEMLLYPKKFSLDIPSLLGKPAENKT